jgi:hypothetical protein
MPSEVTPESVIEAARKRWPEATIELDWSLCSPPCTNDGWALTAYQKGIACHFDDWGFPTLAALLAKIEGATP